MGVLGEGLRRCALAVLLGSFALFACAPVAFAEGTGEISGTVTKAGSAEGIAGIEVCAQGVAGESEESSGGSGSINEIHVCKETTGNGTYTIPSLQGGDYDVEFSEPSGSGLGYITQFYNDKPSSYEANLVPVEEGKPTSGVDAALVRKQPVNTGAPVLSGTPAVGEALSCSNGSWTGEPTLAFGYTWLRDGAPVGGTLGNTYLVQTGDQGTSIACEVTASNASGSASAVSNALSVPGAVVLPMRSAASALKPVVVLPSGRVAVSGGRARVQVICNYANCQGSIELTARVAVKSARKGKRAKSKRKTVVLAKGSYALGAGRDATVDVRLTAAGRRALARAKRHKLSCKAAVTVRGGNTAQRSVVLRQVAKKSRRKRAGKKRR